MDLIRSSRTTRLPTNNRQATPDAHAGFVADIQASITQLSGMPLIRLINIFTLVARIAIFFNRSDDNNDSESAHHPRLRQKNNSGEPKRLFCRQKLKPLKNGPGIDETSNSD